MNLQYHVSCRAVVMIIHGAGEHSGWYGHIAEALTGKGCVVYAHDHGMSILVINHFSS